MLPARRRRDPIPAGQRVLSAGRLAQPPATSRTPTRRARSSVYAEHYLATSGQLYLSDAHQLADYVDGYHAELDDGIGAGSRRRR